jgi:hypothetical protein
MIEAAALVFGLNPCPGSRCTADKEGGAANCTPWVSDSVGGAVFRGALTPSARPFVEGNIAPVDFHPTSEPYSPGPRHRSLRPARRNPVVAAGNTFPVSGFVSRTRLGQRGVGRAANIAPVLVD